MLLGIYLNIYAKDADKWNAIAMDGVQYVLRCYDQMKIRRRQQKHEQLFLAHSV